MRIIPALLLFFSILNFGRIHGQINLDSLLVACYPFSGNAGDSSTNSNHGIVYGPTLTLDRFGNQNSAYSFDGVNDYIEVNHHSDLNYNTNENFAISVWVQINSSQGVYYGGSNDIIAKWADNSGNNNSYPYSIRVYNHTNTNYGKVTGLKFSRPCYEFPKVINNTSLMDGDYHHIVFMRSSDDSLRLFVDGSLVNTEKDITNCATTNSHKVYFGRRGGNKNPGYFKGSIDDVRFYARDLTTQEVSALFYGNYACVPQSPPPPPPIVIGPMQNPPLSTDSFLITDPEDTCGIRAAFSFDNTCLGDTTYFYNESSHKVIVPNLISWNFDDTITIVGIENPKYVFDSPGLHKVTLLVANDSIPGCNDLKIVNIDVLEKPNIDLGEDQTICFTEKYCIKLDDQVSYTWNDSSNQNERCFFETGSYEVIASNICGSSWDDIQIQMIDCYCDLFYPNSFTPNNDGNNDFFRIYTECTFSEFSIVIFNRWGQIIFESFDPNFKWFGDDKMDVPLGYYTFRIKGKLYSNKEIREIDKLEKLILYR